MKKRKVKNLNLNKDKISNFTKVEGGRAPNSFYETKCDDKCSPSEQTNCLHCNQTIPNHVCASFIDCTYDC